MIDKLKKAAIFLGVFVLGVALGAWGEKLLTKKEDEIAKAQAALDAAQAELKIAQTTLNEAKAAVQTEIRAGNAAATTSNGVTTPAPLQTFTAITPAALAEILARAYPDDIVAFVEQLAEAFPDQATAIADGAIAGAPDLTKAIQDAAKKGKDNANLAAAAAVAADEGQGTSP